MTFKQIRAHALVKMADPLNISSIMNILARNGINSDDAVKSIMDAVRDIARKEGRTATLGDLAGVLSERAQNSLAETSKTVGSTVKPAPIGFGKSMLMTMRKYKKPVGLGLAGIAAGGRLYSMLRPKKKKSIFDKIKDMIV